MSTHWPTFDELSALAEHSPEKLEEFRLNEISKIIESAPERFRRRLLGLQFQINCQIQLHSTHMGACMAISKMMHESLLKLNDALHGSYTESVQSPSGDNVIPFQCTSSAV